MVERSASETCPFSKVASSTNRLRMGSFLTFFFPDFLNGMSFFSAIAFRTRPINAAPQPKNAFHFGDGHFVVISGEMVMKREDRPKPSGVVEKLARDTDAVKFDGIRLTLAFQKKRE